METPKKTTKPKQRKSPGGLMEGSTDHPKVFISYSWGTVLNKEWTHKLADRLISDGVEVVIDVYDLKEGQDKNDFMEGMVKDPGVKNVLCVLDQSYMEKANSREKGVGVESILISEQVYKSTKQTKFVPLIKERSEDGEAYTPTFMDGRVYIDFSADAAFEENYQKLLRVLYDVPERAKPPLGKKPEYLFEVAIPEAETQKVPSSAPGKVRVVSTTNPAQLDLGIRLNAVIDDLKLVSQEGLTGERDDLVVSLIEKMSQARHDFAEIIISLPRSGLNNDQKEEVRSFFETLLTLQYPQKMVMQWRNSDYDHYRYMIYETFLTFVALLLRQKLYTEVYYFATTEYFYRTNTGQLRHDNLNAFNQSVQTLDSVRNDRLKLNRISVVVDMIKQRGTGGVVSFDELRTADILLYVITALERKSEQSRSWFPRTTVYDYESYSEDIPPLGELISAERAAKIVKLFGVTTIDELTQKITKAKEFGDNVSYRHFDYSVPSIDEVFPKDMGKRS